MSQGDPAVVPGPDASEIGELLNLLPISGLRDLLPRLAEFWRSRLNCESAQIVIQVDSAAVLQAGLALRRQPPSFLELADDDRRTGTRHQWSIGEIGRAWLDVPADLSAESDPVVFQTSALLLVQAFWMDRAVRSPEARRQLEHEKRESLAEFAAGAGHEINNPVATIVGRTQLLLQDEFDDDRRQQLLTIGAQALRIRDMIGDLMLYGRPPVPVLSDLDFAEILATERPKLEEMAAAQGTSIAIDCDAAIPLRADRTQICVVLHALVRNSVEAIRTGGQISIRATAGGASGNRFALLEVSDNGPGLTEQDRRHLFDPYYSGRQAGRGIGFGLPKCWQIVRHHGGEIDVDSQAGQTTVRVTWPAG